MKSANSSNSPAAARFAGLRPSLLAALCLLALACGLLAGGSSRASANNSPAQDAAAQKTKGGAAGVAGKDAGTDGKGEARTSAAQDGTPAKQAGAKSRDANPLNHLPNPIGCATPPADVAINGASVTGTLASTDCRNPVDNSLYDAYTFTGTGGQLVIIELESTAFDPYLYLLRQGETTLSYRTIQNDDTPGPNNTTDTDSRIVVVLPGSGNETYTILANSATSSGAGAYTLRVYNTGDCTATNLGSATTTPPNTSLATTDCRLHDGSYVDVYSFTAAAGEQVSVTMSSSAVDPFLFLLSTDGFVELARNDDGLTGGGDGNSNRGARIPAPETGAGAGLATLPVAGTYYVLANSFGANQTGAYSLNLTLGAACPVQAITAGQTINGQLVNTTAECRLPFDGSFIDVYTFAGPAGQRIAVTMTAAFDAYLLLYDPQGFLLDENNDGGGGTSARIPDVGEGDFITLPVSGTYRIYANAAGPNVTGTYQLTVTAAPTQTPNPTIALSSATYAVTESDASRSITVGVTRSGDTSGASTVEYRTAAETDAQAQVPCNPTQTSARGTASPRCDFATTVDTLTFGPSETSKTFTIPLINDVHVEGAETFQVELTEARGATLGTRITATVTINDDDTAQPTTNPVRPLGAYGPETGRFFVRMQYLDFLGREPEAGEPWTNVLANCPNPENRPEQTAPPSAGCDRILVSKSFFESDESRLKGRFVFLYHKVSFGSAGNPNYFPEYRDYVIDLQRVTGRTAAETIERRNSFAEGWVTRAAFAARYNGLSNAQFVDALLANVATTPTQAGSGFTRDSLIADLNAGTSRAVVLRRIVESPEVSAQQFNHAYVAAQYYGYLRRTPDLGGYLSWLNAINLNRDNLRVMVDGFMNSTEYVFRFGPN